MLLVCKTQLNISNKRNMPTQYGEFSPLGSYLALESLPPPTTKVMRIIESNWNGSEKASLIVVLILAAYHRKKQCVSQYAKLNALQA